MKKQIVKYLAIAMSLALLICLIPGKGNNAKAAPAESANLLAAAGIDYSVEEMPLNTWLKNIEGWGGTSGGKDRTKATAEKASDGEQALWMNIPEGVSGGYYVFTPKFQVPQAAKVRYSVDYISEGSTVNIWIQFFKADGTTVAAQYSATAPAASDWTTYTMVKDVPADAVTMHVGVSKSAIPGDYYFDNFFLDVPVNLAGSDGLTNSTFVYDELDISLDSTDTRDTLLTDGWAFGTQATAARSAVQLETGSTTNYVLKADNSTTDSVLAIWTPAIAVSGMDKVTANLDIYSGYAEQCYVTFNKADGTQISVHVFQNTTTNAWQTITNTVDVPADAAYARIMLWKVRNYKGATYIDNIQLTAATTTPVATTAPATTVPVTTAPATTAPATTAPATTAPATTAPATTAPTTTAPATTAPATTAAATTSPAATTPDTGDTSGITAMLIVMLLSVTTLAALVSTKFIRK